MYIPPPPKKKLTWLAGKSPCLGGDTSSNGWFSIVMLVFRGAICRTYNILYMYVYIYTLLLPLDVGIVIALIYSIEDGKPENNKPYDGLG